jgi:prolipoprotein diacylglyceryltransferase
LRRWSRCSRPAVTPPACRSSSSAPRTSSGLPIQPFGIIVATGVLIGAEVMRRYALKRGVDEDDLRSLTGWVVVTGFLGAHLFDVLAYEHDKLAKDPLILLKVWDGISSYGGFLGGAMGWWFYVWWKRLTPGMWADATVIGLLLGFSIGRIGCTLVHDHIGRATDSRSASTTRGSSWRARRPRGDPGPAATTPATSSAATTWRCTSWRI